MNTMGERDGERSRLCRPPGRPAGWLMCRSRLTRERREARHYVRIFICKCVGVDGRYGAVWCVLW